MAEKKKEHNGRFKLFLLRGVNTVQEFSCTCNVMYVHVTCTVVTAYAIREGLREDWILKGYHVFLEACYFFGNIVIYYSYHYVYSKMILENDSPILNLCCIRFFYILGDSKFF